MKKNRRKSLTSEKVLRRKDQTKQKKEAGTKARIFWRSFNASTKKMLALVFIKYHIQIQSDVDITLNFNFNFNFNFNCKFNSKLIVIFFLGARKRTECDGA